MGSPGQGAASRSEDRVAAHYDRVTEVWKRWVMGEDLHYGYFTGPSQTLAEATQGLTEHLAALAEIQPGQSVLDVGCGVGTPGIHLAESAGAQVTGISTSPVGVEMANARAAERGVSERARFEVRDATETGLEEGSFDRVFSLESAHLMDKAALFSECFRVLKPGGQMALCDCCLVGLLATEAAQITKYSAMGHSTAVAGRMRDVVHRAIHRAFGSNELEHSKVYMEAAQVAGFEDVVVTDISQETKPTLEHWGRNASEHWDAMAESVGERYVEDFFHALLHMSFGWGQSGGYITLVAKKPG